MPAFFFILIIGAAAGYLATRVMNVQTGVVQTVAIGVLGALIGGVILRFLLTIFGALSGFVGAFLGALLLIWLYQTYLAKR
jgi:uncharacterized membrane protein YeaQ/YmgE (transglycosylase-associated protein family)